MKVEKRKKKVQREKKGVKNLVAVSKTASQNPSDDPAFDGSFGSPAVAARGEPEWFRGFHFVGESAKIVAFSS